MTEEYPNFKFNTAECLDFWIDAKAAKDSQTNKLPFYVRSSNSEYRRKLVVTAFSFWMAATLVLCQILGKFIRDYWRGFLLPFGVIIIVPTLIFYCIKLFI